jgi:hypothetical protein
LIGPDE